MRGALPVRPQPRRHRENWQPEHRFQYNQGTGDKTFQGEEGKSFKTERERDFDLNWDMTRYRSYDYQLGRFNQVDPKADIAPQESLSPYKYGYNNPVRYNDPNGDCPWCLGAIIGAAVEYGSQVSANVLESGELNFDSFTKNIDIMDIGVAAVEGGLTGGVSAVRRTAVKAAVKVTAEVVKNAVDVKTDGEGGFNAKVNYAKKTAIDTGIGLTLDAVGGSGVVKNGKLLKETTPKQAVKASRDSGQMVTREGRQKIEQKAKTKLENVKEVNSQTQTALPQTATGAASERLKDTHNQQQ